MASFTSYGTYTQANFMHAAIITCVNIAKLLAEHVSICLVPFISTYAAPHTIDAHSDLSFIF